MSFLAISTDFWVALEPIGSLFHPGSLFFSIKARTGSIGRSIGLLCQTRQGRGEQKNTITLQVLQVLQVL